MNIDKIAYKIIKDSIKDEFILRMMISYLSDDQKASIMDEIVNEREHILFKKEDKVWFDPIDNKYDTGLAEFKEVRVKRSNIIGLWKPLE